MNGRGPARAAATRRRRSPRPWPDREFPRRVFGGLLVAAVLTACGPQRTGPVPDPLGGVESTLDAVERELDDGAR